MRFLDCRGAAVVLFALWFAACGAQAATMQIVKPDGSGGGLNDTTPATPVGGNAGTTLGQQRRIALQFAADLLGARVASSVPIRIAARFENMACSDSATLARSGPAQFTTGFPRQPRANTLYPQALANALAGRRIAAGTNDINTKYNSTLDEGRRDCLGGARWYYGLDDRQPKGQINFVNTAAHELIHGLGFVSQVALTGSSRGQFSRVGTGQRLPDIFSSFIKDLSLPNQPFWPELTVEQRSDSINNGPNVVWGDANTGSQAATLLDEGLNDGLIQLFAPESVQNGSSISHWDAALAPDQLMEPFATGENNATSGIGLASCVLEDIGWQLINGTRCPDINSAAITDNNVSVPEPESQSEDAEPDASPVSTPSGNAPERNSDDGSGGGCTLNPEARFDPLFGVMLMLALATLYGRRRRRAG